MLLDKAMLRDKFPFPCSRPRGGTEVVTQKTLCTGKNAQVSVYTTTGKPGCFPWDDLDGDGQDLDPGAGARNGTIGGAVLVEQLGYTVPPITCCIVVSPKWILIAIKREREYVPNHPPVLELYCRPVELKKKP